MVADTDPLDHVMDLERRLLQPAVRSSARELEMLLHPDFREVGASGRTWDRESIVAALSGEEPAAGVIGDEDMRATSLADGVVVVTYLSDAAGRRAHRTSVWCRDGDAGWQLLHHQGTLAT